MSNYEDLQFKRRWRMCRYGATHLDDELWEWALKKATAENRSLAEVIRELTGDGAG